jgi:hypothetical protein
MRAVAPAGRAHTPPGLLEFQTKEWLETVARGNQQRVIPDIRSRCSLSEDTIYEALNGSECSDIVLTVIEDAIDNLIFADRFDVPTEPPTKDNLGPWLQRSVGSYKWLGEFLGVKSNTIAAWVSRNPDRLLDFAQRWYEARLALWPEKPREQFEDEYAEYLLDREDWAEDQLQRANELARAAIRQEVAEWEPTADGQAYLEDVLVMGEERARARAFEEGRPHPRDKGSRIPGKLVQVERQRKGGQKPEQPSRYEDRNRDNATRFGAPAPASELWMPAKKVDA